MITVFIFCDSFSFKYTVSNYFQSLFDFWSPYQDPPGRTLHLAVCDPSQVLTPTLGNTVSKPNETRSLGSETKCIHRMNSWTTAEN